MKELTKEKRKKNRNKKERDRQKSGSIEVLKRNNIRTGKDRRQTLRISVGIYSACRRNHAIKKKYKLSMSLIELSEDLNSIKEGRSPRTGTMWQSASPLEDPVERPNKMPKVRQDQGPGYSML